MMPCRLIDNYFDKWLDPENWVNKLLQTYTFYLSKWHQIP